MTYQWHVFLASLEPVQGAEQAGAAGLHVDSIALCYQIRTLDKSRLEQDMGELADAGLRQAIHDAMRFQLDM